MVRKLANNTFEPLEFLNYTFAFYDDNPLIDGDVLYRFRQGSRTFIVAQPFNKISGRYWLWDGNKESPTIKPSFRLLDYSFHCYVKNGKIDILHDSAVKNLSERLSYEEFNSYQNV